MCQPPFYTAHALVLFSSSESTEASSEASICGLIPADAVEAASSVPCTLR
eukprot:NODE_1838_length_539_cov_349.108163_g1492_i0.p6 GENE.NODE_1838_length_539_cov_349.108163_g1492_i0~~NODE_1838_length_539_cov_349.108163_g1492_i0.p6  ORF type:complete len:50 (+),score=9.32 NODE_1838_length_539_cov_349.108163_g1492_i0:386-535(+)